MFFPGVRRRGFHVPHPLIPFALAIGAITLTLLAWALFAPSRAGEVSVPLAGPALDDLRSVAYTVPGESSDEIVVQPISRTAAPRVIASFPNGGAQWPHARGMAAPQGDRLAVLWLPLFASGASLALVDIAAGANRTVPGEFDYNSELAWAPDGTKLAVAGEAGASDKRVTTVFEVDAGSLAAGPVAEFEGAIEVAPVGYSLDSARLFIVVVDQRGSNLYVERSGETEFVAELSPGRTQGWALSPDGSRLAFTDVLVGGSRTHIGRTLLIATGAITTLPAEKDQVGPSWMPGSPIPAFGGPGGSLQLTDPAPGGAFLVPQAWSADGSHVAAVVYSEGTDGQTGPQSGPSTALEIISRATASSPSVRARLSDVSGAEFLGFVRDLH